MTFCKRANNYEILKNGFLIKFPRIVHQHGVVAKTMGQYIMHHIIKHMHGIPTRFLKNVLPFWNTFSYSIINMLISMNYNIKNGIYETWRFFKSPFRSWLSTIWCLKWMPVTIRFQVNEMCGVFIQHWNSNILSSNYCMYMCHTTDI